MKRKFFITGAVALLAALSASAYAQTGTAKAAQHEIIRTERAPIHPLFSQAIRAGDTVYLSGQVGQDPKTLKLVDGGLEAQAHQTFKNLQAVAEAAGGSLKDVVKYTIYLTSADDFAVFNKVMKQYANEPHLTRTTVVVSGLALGSLVEVEAVMYLPKR